MNSNKQIIEKLIPFIGDNHKQYNLSKIFRMMIIIGSRICENKIKSEYCDMHLKRIETMLGHINNIIKRYSKSCFSVTQDDLNTLLKFLNKLEKNNENGCDETNNETSKISNNRDGETNNIDDETNKTSNNRNSEETTNETNEITNNRNSETTNKSQSITKHNCSEICNENCSKKYGYIICTGECSHIFDEYQDFSHILCTTLEYYCWTLGSPSNMNENNREYGNYLGKLVNDNSNCDISRYESRFYAIKLIKRQMNSRLEINENLFNRMVVLFGRILKIY